MDKLLKYGRQPSTWRGIISILAVAGISLNPEQATAIIGTGMALMGLINVFRNETKEEDK